MNVTVLLIIEEDLTGHNKSRKVLRPEMCLEKRLQFTCYRHLRKVACSCEKFDSVSTCLNLKSIIFTIFLKFNKDLLY